MKFNMTQEGRTYQIRFGVFERSDMPGVIDCIEDFYGKGYPYRKYLDADYLEKACQEGNMIVVCGKKGKEVIGISAVDFTSDFQKSGLLMLRVVRHRYRGLGIGDKMQEFLIRLTEERKELLSLYADTMTHDCISQKSLVKDGFVLCGLRLMLYENRIMVPDLSFSKGSKMSQAVMCKRINADRTVRIYCPEEHAAMVQSLYQKLGVACVIADEEEEAALPEKTKCMIHTEKVHASGIILAEQIGADFPERIEHFMQKRTKRHTFLCYLNMEDRNLCGAWRLLKEKGFFFTGIKPLNANGEYMILCHAGGCRINTEEICLQEKGIYLLGYILQHRT